MLALCSRRWSASASITASGFCEVAAESRYTSSRPPKRRPKMGKSLLTASELSATGGIGLDVLARGRELARDLPAHQLFQRLVLELGDERLEEALHDHAHRGGAVKAAALHVEDRRLVQLA